MALICSMIGHQRSRRWARPFADTWRSHCTRCGTRLERVAPRTWVVLEHDETEAPADPL